MRQTQTQFTKCRNRDFTTITMATGYTYTQIYVAWINVRMTAVCLFNGAALSWHRKELGPAPIYCTIDSNELFTLAKEFRCSGNLCLPSLGMKVAEVYGSLMKTAEGYRSLMMVGNEYRSLMMVGNG